MHRVSYSFVGIVYVHDRRKNVINIVIAVVA